MKKRRERDRHTDKTSFVINTSLRFGQQRDPIISLKYSAIGAKFASILSLKQSVCVLELSLLRYLCTSMIKLVKDQSELITLLRDGVDSVGNSATLVYLFPVYSMRCIS